MFLKKLKFTGMLFLNYYRSTRLLQLQEEPLLLSHKKKGGGGGEGKGVVKENDRAANKLPNENCNRLERPGGDSKLNLQKMMFQIRH